MPQCEALTKSGERCKREALEGSRFCSIHQDYDGPLATEVVEEQPQEEAVAVEEQAVVVSEGSKRLRYTGRGEYYLPALGITFSPANPEAEVPDWAYDYLTKLPYFRPA